MEYVNPTTISFVAAGAGAGAYYVYANVIEPQNQAQRVLQAEQAQKELLLNLEEEEAARRGTNKQAKKKPFVVVRPKKVENDNSNVKPEDLNEKISTSNPFDLLEAQHAAANATAAAGRAKKGASKKKVEVPVTTAALAPTVEAKADKAVKFDPTPVIKEMPKVVSKKERKVAASKKEVASVTSPKATVQLTVTATAAAASKKTDQWSEAGSPREPEHLHAPEPFKPVRGHRNTFAALAPTAPAISEVFQPVKSSKSSPVRKQQQQQQQEQKFTVAEKNPAEEPSKPNSVVPSPVASAVSEEERLLTVQELKALQALVQARDLALAAAESRAERSLRKIQELQKQIESEATLVKSAQKTENRAQKLGEKVESLHYTNSLLVHQLSVEKENLKTAQLQAIKKEAELAATAAAAAAAAAAAENVTKKCPDAEWEAKLEALEQERIQRAAQVEHLQELNRELQQHRTQSESEISQLSRSLVDADQRADSALRERNEIHHQLSMTVSDKEARIASLEADIGALEGELENSKVQVEQYAEAVGQAEEVSQNRHEILEGEKHSLLEEIDLLRGHLAKEESKVLERDGEVKKLQQELEVVREQVRSLEANHANALSAKHEEHQRILSTKESTLAVHITNFSTAQAEVEAVRLQLKEAHQSHQGELEKLGQELEKSNAQITTLTESQQAWTTKMAELTERSNESSIKATEQAAALNKRIHELEKDMASKESSHRIVLTEKEDLSAKLSVLENELAQKKAALEELETAKQKVDAELSALIEASDLRKSEIEQEYDALALQVDEQDSELKDLRQQLQQQAAKEKGEDKKDPQSSEQQQQHELFNVQVEGLAVATF
ncbi:hypothetical protein BGZ95_009719 [Linnemannia exigua]|uniref:Uncharacterized protein n=1 Tax=Linnemannia exigua TaxID=604196 RepID=A0AAD4DCY5_9FUNG|nr:hypothetical protein BGZ95_009719 [Linnemannia exigua]